MKWKSSGRIRNMRCTQIHEGADPHTWNDNYLCVPHSSKLRLSWSSAGRIRGKSCIRWVENSDPHTWHDNYLCADPTPGIPTLLEDKVEKEYLGCYKDRGNRALPTYMGNRKTTPECANLCSGFTYFALQWKGECWCGNSGYDRYGTTGGCSCNAADTGGNVGGWKQCVYKVPYFMMSMDHKGWCESARRNLGQNYLSMEDNMNEMNSRNLALFEGPDPNCAVSHGKIHKVMITHKNKKWFSGLKIIGSVAVGMAVVASVAVLCPECLVAAAEEASELAGALLETSEESEFVAEAEEITDGEDIFDSLCKIPGGLRRRSLTSKKKLGRSFKVEIRDISFNRRLEECPDLIDELDMEPLDPNEPVQIDAGAQQALNDLLANPNNFAQDVVIQNGAGQAAQVPADLNADDDLMEAFGRNFFDVGDGNRDLEGAGSFIDSISDDFLWHSHHVSGILEKLHERVEKLHIVPKSQVKAHIIAKRSTGN
eukprot:CAMPEP_0113301580 /NCGR_PEP_ID=MMETSP0010_2-20120614/2751_1 /TAXON_ID=216773 ORGANISM="Corethron hystrix, Strain 308" /NCGR_SAMPLE_ID=MMETSP0010_2 /ASSEMBLY_ACC=CAM_ASM_000155 /LENGTH=482 /DNA_ID=CAMNT_0000155229 /DNA_START=355 /DNA_END=1803 /DNA_ORIENTATION=- /assembly_acc=CAM_ASM_000155